MKNSFSIVGHTADIRLRVSGKTLKALFVGAAKGLAKILGARGSNGTPFVKMIKLKAQTPENLLITFLNEINYLSVSKKAIFKRFKIISIDQNSLIAEISGKSKLTDIAFTHEIKAATYYNLAIQKKKTSLNAIITFDI